MKQRRSSRRSAWRATMRHACVFSLSPQRARKSSPHPKMNFEEFLVKTMEESIRAARTALETTADETPNVLPSFDGYSAREIAQKMSVWRNCVSRS